MSNCLGPFKCTHVKNSAKPSDPTVKGKKEKRREKETSSWGAFVIAGGVL